MSDAPSPAAMPSQSSELLTAETDYKRITDALMQTQRGRRFLAEHARRCRQNQHADLLAALARLERAVAIEPPPGITELRSDLAALTRAVESVRTDVAALRPAVPPDRLRPQDEEMLQLLREQHARLDMLADFWTQAHGPGSPISASTPQPAVETGDSRGAPRTDREPGEEPAVAAQNGAADGPVGEPYGPETPASDLLRQTPIFDLAFDSATATATATDATAGTVVAFEEEAKAAEHLRSGELDEPVARIAVVRDAIEQGGEESGESSDHCPATPELVRLAECDHASIAEADSDSVETILARDDDRPEPEPQPHAPEILAAEIPAARIAAEPPSASLAAEPPSGPVADEASSGSDIDGDSSAAIATAGDPLAPLLALSEEERIALFT